MSYGIVISIVFR